MHLTLAQFLNLQRAITKELSKQQTKQLQVEEEERTKKQRAKSLVKLEEVNRCTEAVEGSMQRAYAENSPLQNRQKEFQLSESTTVLGESGNANSSVLPNDNGNQKKKNNRNKKNKQKVKGISFLPALPTAILKDAGLSTSSVENKPREDIELDQ